MKGEKMSELERNNKTAMTGHLIIVVVMLLFNILETSSGVRSPFYLLAMAVLALGPVAAERITWRQNHETRAIKHLVAIGFALYYSVALFTTNNIMVYAFVIPMVMVATVYQDVKYFVIINTGTLLESIIMVALGASTGRFGYLGLDAGIIQVTIMILVCYATVYTCITNKKNTARKIETLAEAREQAEETLEKITSIAKLLEESITGVYREVEKLKEATVDTQQAMREVTAGAQDSAMAVQNQTAQTEAIQSKVGAVDAAASEIADNMQRTLEVLAVGNKNMVELQQQVEISVKNSEDVASKLEQLDNYMKEMNSIVEIISGITSQTSLLALNASIEAARAGEAGRGFAVVATEISGMATQTKDATVHITDLIGNVSRAISDVVQVIRQMIEGITEEKTGAKDAADSFSEIESRTFAIRDNMDTMVRIVAELKEANQVIVDSIQTISAISEEVSAHASETLTAEQKNAEILENITDMMESMTQIAGK